MMVIHSFAMTWASAGGALSSMGPPPQPPSSYTMVTQVGDENGVLVSHWDTARRSIDGRKSSSGSSTSAHPPPPSSSPELDDIAQAAALSSQYSNPGPYEQASMEAK